MSLEQKIEETIHSMVESLNKSDDKINTSKISNKTDCSGKKNCSFLIVSF